MELDDYEYLMDRCCITSSDGHTIAFEPYRNGDRLIDRVIKDNQLEQLSLEDIQAIAQQYHPLYIVRKKLKQKKADEISNMTTQQVATLSLEQKINYLDTLFPANQTRENLVKTSQKNEEKIRACLFNLDFPKDFWKDEMQKAERFASLVATQPEITDKMKNWKDTTLEDKKAVIQQASRVFEYVYGAVPEIAYFTTAEERAQQKEKGFSDDTHINAAYYSPSVGKIYFNEDRLQNSDNFFAVSVLFHEGTHWRQHNVRFEDPLVNRMFNNFWGDVNIYEDLLNNKTSANYKDLYTMLPDEKHAYGVQLRMEQQLSEKTGIEKTNYTIVDKETQKIHDKGFTMATITQYQSLQK